jgi:predicted membrane channel-forming protein YqfA (hemolysin III family)
MPVYLVAEKRDTYQPKFGIYSGMTFEDTSLPSIEALVRRVELYRILRERIFINTGVSLMNMARKILNKLELACGVLFFASGVVTVGSFVYNGKFVPNTGKYMALSIVSAVGACYRENDCEQNYSKKR